MLWQHVGQGVVVKVAQELLKGTAENRRQTAIAGNGAAIARGEALDQGKIVFGVADQGTKVDFVGRFAQPHAAMFAPHRLQPAALGQPMCDFHQMGF